MGDHEAVEFKVLLKEYVENVASKMVSRAVVWVTTILIPSVFTFPKVPTVLLQIVTVLVTTIPTCR